MGIDKVTKAGNLPASPDVDGARGPENAGSAFRAELDKVDGARGKELAGASLGSVEGASAAQASPLGQLRAGEIDVERYVDLKVEEATGGLSGLSPMELETIKTVLRDQMATDPAFRDLIQSATGERPAIPDE